MRRIFSEITSTLWAKNREDLPADGPLFNSREQEKNSLEEISIMIAPFFIVLYVFSVPLSFSLKSIMSVLSIGAIILTPYYRKQLLEAFNTLWGRTAVIFFVYLIIACLWSDAPYSMRLQVIDKYSKLIYLPIFAVVFINPKTRRSVFNSYFAIMLLTCLVSLLKQKGWIVFGNMMDSGEVFHNHIATGFMIALAVYFAAFLFFDVQINKWLRAYYLLMVVFGSYQIFFLNTGRTGYVIYGFLMSLLIVQKLSFKKALMGFMLFCSSLSLIYTLSPLMQSRTALLVNDIKSLHQHKDTSLGFRVQFHDYAHSLFKQHPIIGIGTGGFKYRFSQDHPIPEWNKRLNDPHSQYWLTLAEQGIIGIIFLLIFYATLFMTAFKLNNENKSLILGILLAFCIGSFSDTILCYSTAGSLLIIFCALGFGELLEKNKELW
ncbi:O-antigen ligase family protein [Legionella sp.]|uniref:O-antigen ligase family protein n=1 Tax=Legionella sp. TaxID=459 RepID=UPI003C9B75DA